MGLIRSVNTDRKLLFYYNQNAWRDRTHVFGDLTARIETPPLSRWSVTHRFGLRGGPSFRYRDEVRTVGVFFPAYFGTETHLADQMVAEYNAEFGDGAAFRIEYDDGDGIAQDGTYVILTDPSRGTNLGVVSALVYSVGIGRAKLELEAGGYYYLPGDFKIYKPSNAWFAMLGLGYAF